MKKTIRDFKLNNKKVIIRCDFNVPLKDWKIIDDTRIKNSLKTIQYAIDKNAKVILLSHLGRIKEDQDKIKNNLKIVADRLSDLLAKKVIFVDEVVGDKVKTAIQNMRVQDVVLLQNTRYEDLNDKKESGCDLEFAKELASYGDIFINDAFGTIHRKHASNYGISKYLESGIGFLVEEELAKLETVIGAQDRLDMLSKDIIEHYEQRADILNGKAMIVCMTRKIAINLYKEIINKRPDWKEQVKVVLTDNNDDPTEWHEIVGNKKYRDDLATEFKDEKSKLKIVIVVDMWLTGFDVPDLATMYIDKPMRGHNLMQAIARVNRVYKDKEAGLIVDYIGIGADLRNALNEYTNRDRDKVPDITAAYVIVKEKLEVMRDFFYGFDYQAFFSSSNQLRLRTLADGINYVLSKDEEEKKDFIAEATALSQAETLARSILDEQTKLEVEFFKGVKVGVNKITGKGHLTTTEVNQRILKVLEQAIQEDGIIDIFKAAERSNPEISILSEEYLEGIKKSKNKNIAAELLRRLIDGNIRVFKRTNLVKSELFSQKMAEIMKKYNNRLITSAEVIEELLNLSKEVVEARNEGKEKGLTDDEYAFYDALVKDPNVLKEMQDEVLIQLAHELTETVRNNRTVDWDKKESARAFMRREIKRLLRKYHYPPTKADEAVQTVVRQAELMGENYDIKISDEKSIEMQHGIEYSENDFESLSMVAEEGEKYTIKEDNN